MSTSEFATAAVIAVYAMFGSALLSAAISSPRNCKKVLDRLLSDGLIGNLIIGFMLWLSVYSEAAQRDSLLWLAAAHTALFVLCLFAKWIANAADSGEEPES